MRALLAASVFALVALLGASCSVGTRTQGGSAQLVVTRDFGQKQLLSATEDPIEGSETVMRFLMRNARVKTRYGGRFVNAISGVDSKNGGGRRLDWFYYVNGIEAEVGAAERKLAGGDRVWWDYHDWTSVMRIPAVVGSFPEPFVHGAEGKRYPVRIDCGQHAEQACRDATTKLEAAGIAPSTSGIGATAGKEVLRFVIGTWSEARVDAAARQLEEGPDKSGVLARFGAAPGGGYELELLDEAGHPARALGAGAGIVAATRFEEQQPTWVVSGTDNAGLDRAVAMLDKVTLRNLFAVASDGRTTIPLPVNSSATSGP